MSTPWSEFAPSGAFFPRLPNWAAVWRRGRGHESNNGLMPLGVQEVQRANQIVRLLALLLLIDFDVETVPSAAPVPMAFTWYDRWLVEVYQDPHSSSWVLILSRCMEVAYRTFECHEVGIAAQHIRDFVGNEFYRSNWVRPWKG